MIVKHFLSINKNSSDDEDEIDLNTAVAEDFEKSLSLDRSKITELVPTLLQPTEPNEAPIEASDS